MLVVDVGPEIRRRRRLRHLLWHRLRHQLRRRVVLQRLSLMLVVDVGPEIRRLLCQRWSQRLSRRKAVDEGWEHRRHRRLRLVVLRRVLVTMGLTTVTRTRSAVSKLAASSTVAAALASQAQVQPVPTWMDAWEIHASLE